MSNPGQAVLSIGGAAIGWFVGGPSGAAWGFQLGSLAGQVAFPTQLPTMKGPRIGEATIQTASVGSPIPIVYGNYALAGNVIWFDGLTETVNKQKSGGKGAPQQTTKTYTYSTNVAVGICEGPIIGIRRVWADAVLIYDRRPQQPGETDEDYELRLAVTQQTEQNMAVYLGTETQLADTTIEAIEGIGGAQAYRDLAYVVFNDFQLANYGNRLPNFRFEVANGVEAPVEVISNGVMYPWTGAEDPRNMLNIHEMNVSGWGTSSWLADLNTATGNRGTGPYTETEIETIIRPFFKAKCERDLDQYLGYSDPESPSPDAAVTTTKWGDPYPDYGLSGYAPPCPYYVQGDTFVTNGVDTQDRNLMVLSWAPTTLMCLEFRGPGGYDYGIYNDAGSSGVGGADGSFGSVLQMKYRLTDAEDTFVANNSVGAFLALQGNAGFTGVEEGGARIPGNRVAGFYVFSVRVNRTVRPPIGTADLIALPRAFSQIPGTDWFIDLTGALTTRGGRVYGGTWTYDTSTTYKVLGQYADPNGYVSRYPLNPCVPLGHANYNSQAFWEAAYAEAVANQQIPSGYTYGVEYPKTQSWAYLREAPPSSADVCVPIADIVTDICARVGVADIDVITLDDCVNGYALISNVSARDALAQLQIAGRFDAVESAATLKFIKRGGAIARSFMEDDLCAHESGSERPAAMQVTRTQEVELPRRLQLQYVAQHRDYDVASQYAARVTTDALGVQTIEVAVSLDDDFAAGLAEQLLYESWAGRNTYSFAVSSNDIEIEPTDVLEIPVDGQTVRARVLDVELRLGGVLDVRAVGDDDGSYTGTAIAAVSGAVPSNRGSVISGAVCPSEIVALDLPSLRTQDSDGGYYAAVRGLCSTWTCAAIYRSSDGGATYSYIADTDTEATIGTLALDVEFDTSVPSPEPDPGSSPQVVYDEVTTITVVLDSGGTLESVSDTQIVNGENLAAVGADGRWEVMQFKTATLESGDVWALTDLVRGRFGTAAFMGTQLAGDRFVLMSAPGILRLSSPVNAIGVESLVKVVSCGQGIDEAVAIAFTPQGRSYIPTVTTSLSDVSSTPPTDGQVLVYDSTTGTYIPTTPSTLLKVSKIRGAAWSNSVEIDAAEALPVTVYCPAAGNIVRCVIIGDAAGDCVIDVRKGGLVDLPAIGSDSICFGVEPELTADLYLIDTTLTGWDTAVAAGDVLSFVLVSSTTFKLLSIQLEIEEILQ